MSLALKDEESTPSLTSGDRSSGMASVATASPLWPERYAMLDAWRGIWALIVVAYHLVGVKLGPPAVMIFFVISGYCITASAEACLRKKLPFKTFLWRRVRRIYPPYALSLVFFIATRIVKLALGRGNQLDRTPLEFLQNATLMQWVTLVFDPQPAAPANQTLFVAAYWSLCYEEQLYFATALLMVTAAMLRCRLLWPIVALSVIGLVWNIALPAICYGVFIEYWAQFALGSLVFYRLCRVRTGAGRWLIDGIILAVIAWSGWMTWEMGIYWPERRLVYNELFVASLFALVLVITRPVDTWIMGSPVGPVLRWLGVISYSLYLIHQFNVVLIGTTAAAVLPAATPDTVLVAAQIAGHVGLATVFWYFCERPFLNQSLDRTPTQAGFPSPKNGGMPSP